MGFDDFFEDKHKRYGNYREHRYHDDHDGHDDHRYSHESYPSHYGHSDHQQWITILNKVRSNKKLKLIVILAGIVILIIAAALFIALLPLIVKLINYVSQNGLQSILDEITGFIDKLWKGSGK